MEVGLQAYDKKQLLIIIIFCYNNNKSGVIYVNIGFYP